MEYMIMHVWQKSKCFLPRKKSVWMLLHSILNGKKEETTHANCYAKTEKKKKKQISKKWSYWNPLSNLICGESSDLESIEGSKKDFPGTHTWVQSPMNGHIISENRLGRGNNVRFDGAFCLSQNWIYVCNCLCLFVCVRARRYEIREWNDTLCSNRNAHWQSNSIFVPSKLKLTHADDHKLCKIMYLIDKTIRFRLDLLICACALSRSFGR